MNKLIQSLAKLCDERGLDYSGGFYHMEGTVFGTISIKDAEGLYRHIYSRDGFYVGTRYGALDKYMTRIDVAEVEV